MKHLWITWPLMLSDLGSCPQVHLAIKHPEPAFESYPPLPVSHPKLTFTEMGPQPDSTLAWARWVTLGPGRYTGVHRLTAQIIRLPTVSQREERLARPGIRTFCILSDGKEEALWAQEGPSSQSERQANVKRTFLDVNEVFEIKELSFNHGHFATLSKLVFLCLPWSQYKANKL